MSTIDHLEQAKQLAAADHERTHYLGAIAHASIAIAEGLDEYLAARRRPFTMTTGGASVLDSLAAELMNGHGQISSIHVPTFPDIEAQAEAENRGFELAMQQSMGGTERRGWAFMTILPLIDKHGMFKDDSMATCRCGVPVGYSQPAGPLNTHLANVILDALFADVDLTPDLDPEPAGEDEREALPVVSHKGPHDSDESMFLTAADNLDRGYPLGGGNLTRAVVVLIRREVERARGFRTPEAVTE